MTRRRSTDERLDDLERAVDLLRQTVSQHQWLYRLIAGVVITALTARFVMMGGGNG